MFFLSFNHIEYIFISSLERSKDVTKTCRDDNPEKSLNTINGRFLSLNHNPLAFTSLASKVKTLRERAETPTPRNHPIPPIS